MKKTIALCVLGLGLFAGTNAFAQESAPTDPQKTQQVIAAIPSLQAISAEIASFEAKTAGKKEEFKNASADLSALLQKYANELQLQLAAHKDNAEIVAALTSELNRVNAQLANLKK
jgi:hypothetical protein